MLKLIFSMIALVIAAYLSWAEYREQKKSLTAYEELYAFAKKAEYNLHNDHKDIEYIITDSFNTTENKSSICRFSPSEYFSQCTKQALLDYIADYNALDIDRILEKTQQFTVFAEKELDRRREGFKKMLPSLSVPPTIAFIVVLLIV